MVRFTQIIPLKDKKHDRVLTIMIALMVCSIIIIECSALFLSNLSANWYNSVSHIATIDVPANTQRSTVSKLDKILTNNSLVEKFNKINKEEISTILTPWIDKGLLQEEDIPLPTIYTLSLKSDNSIERDKLKFEIKAIDPSIKLETHENWLDTAFKRAKTLKTLAWLIGIILTVTLIGSISLLTRTRVHLNTDAIRLLHTSGATDTYILKQFIIYILEIAFKGILIGSIATALLLTVLSWSTKTPEIESVTYNTLTNTDMMLLAVSPIAILILILTITSQTVMTTLKRMI